jgi:hypothetical protein
LGTAADEVESIRTELEREEPAPGPAAGLPSREVLEQITQAWIGQREMAAHIVEQVRRLAGDVAQAAGNYRAVDDLDRGHSRGD